MAKAPTSKTPLATSLSKLKATDVAALSRLGSLETTSREFGSVFAENPAAALAAKGIMIDAAQAKKITSQMADMKGAQQSADGVSVVVTVGVGF